MKENFQDYSNGPLGKNVMIKLCFITAARSEYGLLRWIMQDVKDSASFELQLIVCGGHLLESQGHTIDQILEDGFTPDCTIPFSEYPDIDDLRSLTYECSDLMKGCAEAFHRGGSPVRPSGFRSGRGRAYCETRRPAS